MQIHELDNFIGVPGQGDFLAIDDGNWTYRVDANNLGVTTQMTQAEADAGTSTDPRVLTPKMLHDYVEQIEVLIITISSVSSLPVTKTDSRITSDMVVVQATLSAPAEQINDWTVTTSNGSLTIGPSGALGNNGTDVTLYLMKSR